LYNITAIDGVSGDTYNNNNSMKYSVWWQVIDRNKSQIADQ
jgi:hypothetical protein